MKIKYLYFKKNYSNSNYFSHLGEYNYSGENSGCFLNHLK